jgi:hypothetical protein
MKYCSSLACAGYSMKPPTNGHDGIRYEKKEKKEKKKRIQKKKKKKHKEKNNKRKEN